MLDPFSLQVIAQGKAGVDNHFFQRVKKTFVDMKNRMRYIMQKIMGINFFCVGGLTAAGTKISLKRCSAIFTG